jgi:ATPase subunit of ABC transporter with duplicated ATPase domains
LLIDKPDLILLDEPTNDLDRAGRDMVAHFIADWPGAVVVASHDRALLEHVDRIVELSPVRVRIFGGGWSAFAAARDAEQQRLAAAVGQAEAELRETRLGAQVARERQARRESGGRTFAKSGSAPRISLGLAKRRAEATTGQVNATGARMIGEAEGKLDAARREVEQVTPLSIVLPATGLPRNRTVLRMEDVVLGRGGRSLFGPLNFAVTGPERVVIEGPNGAGKTSLMKLITGEVEPTSGTVVRGVEAGYLDQHVALLNDSATIFDNLRASHPDLTENESYAALARFAFRNREASRIVGELSGGERLRAGLACILSGAAPPQLLLLDEPTNHLDVNTIEILENALRDFDGCIILASHDPAFLKAIGVARAIDIAANEERSFDAR